MILAIDPGTKRTGWVFITEADGRARPVLFGISAPGEMRPIIENYIGQIGSLVIEKPV